MTEVTPEKIDELVGGKVQEHEVHAHAHSHSHGGAPCTGHGHGEQTKDKPQGQPSDPEMPSPAKMARQMVMLPVLFLSNKIDWKNEDYLLALQAAFASISIVLIITLQFTLLKIAQKAEKGRVQKPGYKFKQTVADDGTVSFEQYDNLMTREVRLGVVMSVFISGAVFWKWGTVHPLIAMCVMQPLAVWDLPAVHIHLFGKAGPEYERPWATKAGGENPLAAWAEKKKEEMEEELAAKEAAAKKLKDKKAE